jgi:hypothetical protein
MTDEFENQLRRVLRPVDAPEGFTERLMQRLPGAAPHGSEPVVVTLPVRAERKARNFTIPAALAASLLGAVLLGQYTAVHRIDREEAAGRAASREILQALRVTSQKLDLAYEAVNDPPSSSEPVPGDEENRS